MRNHPTFSVVPDKLRPMDDDDNEFNEMIRYLLRLRGESTNHLSAALGVSRSAAGRRLTGDTAWSLRDLRNLADAWQLEVTDLVQGADHAAQKVLTKKKGNGRRAAGNARAIAAA